MIGGNNMTKQSMILVDEGKYVIHVQTLKMETDEPSAMANYLSESAIVTNEGGSLYVTFMLMDHQIVTGFQIEDEAGELIQAADKQVNEESNTRFEMFQLGQLPILLHIRVQYEVEHEGQTMKGDEALRLSFDENSLERVDNREW